MSHTYHRLFTLHPRGDREVVLPKYPSLEPLYLLQLFTFDITGGFESQGVIPIIGGTIKLALTGRFARKARPGSGEWLEAVYEGQEDERRKAIDWARLLLLFHLALIGVSIALEL